MKKRGLLIGLTVILVAAIAVAVTYFLMQGDQEEPPVTITNFEECVEAGFTVTEIYPRECRTDDGQVFTEQSPEHSDEATDDNVSTEHSSEAGVIISVDEPLIGDVIQSPLLVTGAVPGSWSFEASFGLELLDANGESIAEGFAVIDGEWMTEDMVPFTATIEFEAPSGGTGTLVLHKANPSGDESRDDYVMIPVRFSE